MKRYIVRLTATERRELKELISTGKHSAHKLTRARILLKANQRGSKLWLTDKEIAEAIEVSIPTVERVRRVFVEDGFEATLNYRKPKGRPPYKIDGDAEAHLVALVCSHPPEGRQRWTLQLLADRLVRLEFFDSVSPETVRKTLKKTNLNLGREKSG